MYVHRLFNSTDPIIFSFQLISNYWLQVTVNEPTWGICLLLFASDLSKTAFSAE